MFKIFLLKNYYYKNSKYFIVSLIDFNSKYLGIYKTKDAINKGFDLKFDLLVLCIKNFYILECKFVNSDKIKYLYNKYLKNNKKLIKKKKKLKEMSFNLFIANDDYNNKLKFIIKFFINGSNVKIYVNYKGREKSKREFINLFIFKLTDNLKNYGYLDGKPNFLYKNVCLNFISKFNV